MASFKIKIKPTSGGANISVETSSDKTIAELKDAVSAEASIPAAEQRLIYKGQVLKNERTVDSYGEALTLMGLTICYVRVVLATDTSSRITDVFCASRHSSRSCSAHGEIQTSCTYNSKVCPWRRMQI